MSSSTMTEAVSGLDGLTKLHEDRLLGLMQLHEDAQSDLSQLAADVARVTESAMAAMEPLRSKVGAINAALERLSQPETGEMVRSTLKAAEKLENMGALLASAKEDAEEAMQAFEYEG